MSFITTVRFCDGLTMSLVDWLCSGIFKCLHSVGLCSLLAFFGCNASYSRGLHGTDFSVQLPQKICYLLPLPSTKFMFCPAPIHKSPQVKVDFFQYIHEISIKLFQVRPLATTYPSINAPDILFVIKKNLHLQTTVNFNRKSSIGNWLRDLAWQKVCKDCSHNH